MVLSATTTDVNNNLVVDGTATFSSTVSLSSIDVTGNSALGGTLDVTGNSALGGTLDVSGTTTLEATIIGDSLGVTGNFTVETHPTDAAGTLHIDNSEDNFDVVIRPALDSYGYLGTDCLLYTSPSPRDS